MRAIWPYNSKPSAGDTAFAQTAVLSFSVICIFLAATVRGYSGFGFSLLVISSISLLLISAAKGTHGLWP